MKLTIQRLPGSAHVVVYFGFELTPAIAGTAGQAESCVLHHPRRQPFGLHWRAVWSRGAMM